MANAAPGRDVRHRGDAGEVGESRPSDAARTGSEVVASGRDFGPLVQTLFRVAACAGRAPLPENVAAGVVADHCGRVEPAIRDYKRKWLARAAPFLRRVVPRGLPTRVVYPFGGGDMLTVLATFPDATEITTISLEGVGDVRSIAAPVSSRLRRDLRTTRHTFTRLLKAAFSGTGELNDAHNSRLPGHLIVVLGALAVHGHEPVSLRYFTLNPDGTIHYLTAEEIETADRASETEKTVHENRTTQRDNRKKKTKTTKKKKKSRELAVSIFSNAELVFRKVGQPDAPEKVYRHIAFNLDDKWMQKDPSLLRHLEAKGTVTAMTKAASHLLWRESFSTIRKYLLDYMEWMISDATGVPANAARAAGFEQITWGRYVGAYFPHPAKKVEKEMIKLWKTNPHQPLDFRYGYFDARHHNHLMITRRITRRKSR